MKYFATLLFLSLTLQLAAQVSPFIHVDQFGYFADENKVAVLSNPVVGYNSSDSYEPGDILELRNQLSDEVVFSAAPVVWDLGNVHDDSGDEGWWFDFSSVTESGSYYVYDPETEEASASFEINANPYSEVLKASIKMFYYNRCNFTKESPYAQSPWTDDNNFLNNLQDSECRSIDDPGNASLEKDLRGGWFDAGDYNKYVTFASGAVHELLNAYKDNPNIFGDDWGWPESGNDLPDILDEVIWELDWLMKMTNEDGSVHIKMGSQNYQENTSSPPSANMDQRFYEETCTSASAAAASVLAHGANILFEFEDLESYSEDLQNRAEKCFEYFFNAYEAGTLETNCDQGQIVAGDADRDESEQIQDALIGAIYLFKLTEDNFYHAFIDSVYAIVEPLSNGFWGPYVMPLNEALLYYTTHSEANPAISNDILNSAEISVNNNWDGFYAFSENDLYRAESPSWIYHWGSNLPKSGIANLALLMRKYEVVPSENDALYEKAMEQMHYFHGVNPLSLVQLSNMYGLGGDHCVNEVYHTWFYDETVFDHALDSEYGPAPGFVTVGANQNYSVAGISPPYGQPPLKSYLDFNSGYPDNSWEISEPAIYYQAYYVRMLSNFVNNEVITSDIHIQADKRNIEIFPNPSSDYVRIRGIMPNYIIEVLDELGNIVEEVASLGSEAVIDLTELIPGIYFARVKHAEEGNLWVEKIILMD